MRRPKRSNDTPREIDIRYIIGNLLNRFRFILGKQPLLSRLDKTELYNDALYVTGWAISKHGLRDIERIEVYLDGHFIGNATYGRKRPDVRQIYPEIKDSGQSGFHFSADIATFRQSGVRGRHVTVKVIGGDHASQWVTKACTQRRYPEANLPDLDTYQLWYDLHKCRPEELEIQRQIACQWMDSPLISIIVPVFNSQPQWLDKLLTSIHQQSYPAWECLIVDDASPKTRHLAVVQRWCQRDSRFRFIQHKENQGVSNTSQTGVLAAQGSYLCIVDHDDLVEPQALFEVAQVIRAKHPDVIYSDEIIMFQVEDMIQCEFRPDFNYHFLLSHPYIVHLTVLRREIVLKVGGFKPHLQVSQDYDLLLRVAAITQDFYHLPKVLYRWRDYPHSTGHRLKDQVMTQSLAALNHHLQLKGFDPKEAWAEEGLFYNFFRIRYAIQPAKLSVVILTKDRVELLRTCLESFQRITRIPQGIEVEWLIVDNGSTCSETLEYLAHLRTTGHQVLRIDAPFNFSVLNNRAVEQATGSLLLLMNNDIEIIEPGWLEAMLELMMLPEVAAVGAKLLYSDRAIIQHAGVIVGYDGSAVHDHQFFPERDQANELLLGHCAALLAIRECMAVTAACMLVRRAVFDSVGGFDENIRVGYNDTDLCLKMHSQGYKILFTPYARLVHHESASRGRVPAHYDPHPEDSILFVQRWAQLIQAGDPFYNRNLVRSGDCLFEPDLTSKPDSSLPLSEPSQVPPPQMVNFQCNVCGHFNQNIPEHLVNNRETQSCQACQSSLRMRSIIHALSLELFGKSLILPDFPINKSIQGIGMSDWDGYADLLSQKFSYVNTYYHTEPKLDITQIPPEQESRYDFIISSDVFEHIPPPVSIAFHNVYRLLKPGGVLIFTVPYKKDGVTEEHFPELWDFKIILQDGKPVLFNRTRDGREQVFEQLISHGGEGFTIEMRMFSEQSLYRELQNAGFESIKTYQHSVPEFGIIWPIDYALPMTARKPEIFRPVQMNV